MVGGGEVVRRAMASPSAARARSGRDCGGGGG